MKSSLRAMCVTAMMTVMVIVGAWLTIPVTPPFTMQTLVLYIAAWLLGRRKGVASVVLYLLLGAVGLPVFSGFQGGVGVLLGPTGGYLIGFLALVLVAGTRHSSWRRRVILSAIGTLCCYAIGTVWYAAVYAGFSVDSLGGILVACVLPFLLPDAAKLLLAVLVCRRVEPTMSRLL